MEAELRVGPIVAARGTVNTGRAETTGAFVTTDGHARFQEPVLGGRVFIAATANNVSLGTALTATAVTLTLYNPATSGIYMVVLWAMLGITTIPAASTTSNYFVHAVTATPLAAVPTSVTAAANVFNAMIGNSNSPTGKAYTAATLPATPVSIRTILSYYNDLAAGDFAGMTAYDPVDGSIILTPNTSITIQGVGAAASSGNITYCWEEVAIL